MAIEDVMKALAQNHKIIAGANQTVVHGKETSFKSDADFKSFQKVLVDGKEVSSSNYVLKEGSTEVTLKAEFLKTLSVGEHTLTIESTNGQADTKFVIEKTTASATPNSKIPQTGDVSIVSLWTTTVLVSACISLILTLKRKKSIKQ